MAAAGGVEKGKDERQSRQPSSDSVRTRAPAHTARSETVLSSSSPSPPRCLLRLPSQSPLSPRPLPPSATLSVLLDVPPAPLAPPATRCSLSILVSEPSPATSAGRQWRRTLRSATITQPPLPFWPTWERRVVHHPIPPRRCLSLPRRRGRHRAPPPGSAFSTPFATFRALPPNAQAHSLNSQAVTPLSQVSHAAAASFSGSSSTRRTFCSALDRRPPTVRRRRTAPPQPRPPTSPCCHAYTRRSRHLNRRPRCSLEPCPRSSANASGPWCDSRRRGLWAEAALSPLPTSKAVNTTRSAFAAAHPLRSAPLSVCRLCVPALPECLGRSSVEVQSKLHCPIMVGMCGMSTYAVS